MSKNIIIKILFFFVLINFSAIAEEFRFEGNEILILENGNKIKSENGAKIISSDDIIITSQKFEYDKIKNYLFLEENIKVDDQKNQTIILADKVFYNRLKEEIISSGYTEIMVNNSYTIKTESIRFDRKKNEIFSETDTSIIDKDKNILSSKELVLNINSKVLKAKDVTIDYVDGSKSSFDSFFGDLNSKKFLGKDAKYIFNKKAFGNINNDPRIYGNVLKRDENQIILSKGIFTTCKKRDGCPPWTLKADKIIHDERKKTINYLNAWLEVYDKPVLYFPRFFHPDPTVKRQSGFLIPQLNDSGNTGTSIQIPYYKVIADNEDMTIQPRLFTNNDIILQNEYRKIGKNYDHISDFSFYTSAFSDASQTSKSHFFSNTKFQFEDGIFEEHNIEINFEQVANDTYLKKYKINSPLIKSDTLMHSFVEFSGYNDDSSIVLSTEVYEDLTKRTSDRYEIVLPNINYSKDLKKNFDLKGSLNFQSDFFQKQFETNKYEQVLNNSILYSSPKRFDNNGLVKNFQLSLLNPNKSTKTGSSNESQSKNQVLSQFMYNLSYPLSKQSEYYNSFITPNLSYRFSPNKTKNMSDSDRRLDISNINSFNRISENDAVEAGHSITAGFGYKRNDKFGDEKISLEIAQVISDTVNDDLPIKSSLNKKYSDLIGNFNFKISDILKLDYDFMLDDGLSTSNYNSIKTTFSVNNFITTFEYLEESDIIGSSHYVGNETTFKLNNSNSFAFKTRSNREIDMTEFYNLMYQYENDCLRAALEYNKTFYADSDIKPEEELLFSLTIMPFSKISSTNLK